MKLRNYLKLFENLDPEIEIYQENRNHNCPLQTPNYKYGYVVDINGETFFGDNPTDIMIEKAIILF